MQTQSASISTEPTAAVAADVAGAERGLKAAAIFTVATGLLFSSASLAETDFGVRFLLDVVFFRLGEGPDSLEASHRLVNAILGGVMVGWGVMIWLLVDRFLVRAPQDVKRVLIVGLATWFVVDSAGSIASGGWLNAVLNIGFLGVFLVPLRKL